MYQPKTFSVGTVPSENVFCWYRTKRKRFRLVHVPEEKKYQDENKFHETSSPQRLPAGQPAYRPAHQHARPPAICRPPQRIAPTLPPIRLPPCQPASNPEAQVTLVGVKPRKVLRCLGRGWEGEGHGRPSEIVDLRSQGGGGVGAQWSGYSGI